MKYKIIDTVINTILPKELREKWKPFETEEKAEINISIHTCPENYYGIDAVDIDSMKYCLRIGSAVLFADRFWQSSVIYGEVHFEIAALTEMQLYSYLLSKHTLLLHSAIIDYKGNGILFLGPSGIGKTTQAELWNQYEQAEILNGDLSFVRKQGRDYYAFGSPWHGSSPYFENKKVKLKTAVLLEQGEENRLEPLRGFSAMQAMMKQVFLPYWYREAMSACLDTIDEIMQEVPAYTLVCRPDRDAVELLKKELFNNRLQDHK